MFYCVYDEFRFHIIIYSPVEYWFLTSEKVPKVNHDAFSKERITLFQANLDHSVVGKTCSLG